ncbi:MAG: DUF2071 domain-containing protein [Verrucomicrobiales bacterium]|nr:DUF2071 domain-containing protein [Verrucomicrobiales bacterium]MCP5557531.1 DUF2071 domain-containing protein [Verrucomicrobiaceae bacterium]
MNTALPTLKDRLALRQRPSRPVVGYQRWNELLFLHWDFPAEVVQASLPPGLHVDTFDGRGYVGVVPFFMERIRPRFLPAVPGISWFLELNVRTYVFDDRGQPGVWFYSLDCNQALAVAIAQRFFHLPYWNAEMTARRVDHGIAYDCQRKGDERRASYQWTAGRTIGAATPGSLEFFLLERYLLFSTNAAGALFTGQVHHAPYQMREMQLHAQSTVPMTQAGFDARGEPASVLAAAKVDVEIFPLRRAATTS